VVRFIVIWQKTPSDVEAFDRHYREVHIPLGKSLPGLRRYSLSRNLNPVRGEAPYRVAELDFDDADALRRAFESPEGRATAEDVEKMSEWSPGVQSMIYEIEDL
jgi:uncharacterized protein (TIGR02118 family)